MINDFPNYTDEQVKEFLKENDFGAVRKLESGEWVGILQLMFTWSVCTRITEARAFTYRWCFEDLKEAVHFFQNMQEFDDIPELRTTLKGHRYLDKPLLVEKDERGFDKW